MPENRIAVNDLTHLLWRLGFLILVLGADVGLIIWDIYLESGGLKLILNNLTWPHEIRAFLTLIGIDPGYVSPPVIAACVLSILLMANAYLIVHFCVGALSTCQPIFRSLAVASQQSQKINRAGFIDEVYPIFKSLFFALCLFVFMLVIFFKLTMPMAQLQLASKMWKSDFEIQIESDKIVSATKQEIPDIKALMQRHSGEFTCAFIKGFPYALLCMHFAAGLLTEIFLLYVLTHLTGMEIRHSRVLKGIGYRFAEIFPRRGRVSSQGNTGEEVGQENSNSNFRTSSTPYDAERPSDVREQTATETNSTQQEMNRDDHQTPSQEEEVMPEDQPTRVIGGSESITPAEAMKKENLYQVIKNQHGYIIYTKEFYEKLQSMNNAN